MINEGKLVHTPSSHCSSKRWFAGGRSRVRLPAADLETLRRLMWERQKQARAAVWAYNRASWIRFAAVFIPGAARGRDLPALPGGLALLRPGRRLHLFRGPSLCARRRGAQANAGREAAIKAAKVGGRSGAYPRGAIRPARTVAKGGRRLRAVQRQFVDLVQLDHVAAWIVEEELQRVGAGEALRSPSISRPCAPARAGSRRCRRRPARCAAGSDPGPVPWRRATAARRRTGGSGRPRRH